MATLMQSRARCASAWATRARRWQQCLEPRTRLMQTVVQKTQLYCPSAPTLGPEAVAAHEARLASIRNIGISAHIDSGKTTLTERILYYTGKIQAMHEVRGRDNVGATMDSMDLERERGITIQSAATHVKWNDFHFNIIDTPGHIDFTIEVERALRVLDGAILVLCALGGVQSQTITVDRQMRRYSIPRLVFVNKLDRTGARPFEAAAQLRSQLGLQACPLQIPIGLEGDFSGLVDIVRARAVRFEGQRGERVVEVPVPQNLLSELAARRKTLIESLADADEQIADAYLAEREPTVEEIAAAVRRCTIARTFIPVLFGSAYKNTGVQALLDAVCDYLPAPNEVKNYAIRNLSMRQLAALTEQRRIDVQNQEERAASGATQEDERSGEVEDLPVLSREMKIGLETTVTKPLVALAFKLEEGRFGQLTYVRVYQGMLMRGATVVNTRTQKKVRVTRLVRVHSNQLEEVASIPAGEICAVFGVECSSGDTFTAGDEESGNISLSSIYVPEPVVSLCLKAKGGDVKGVENITSALNRFQKEDPTFKYSHDPDSHELIISGMGELHLEIYVERMRREYNVSCETGKPRVAYRETILKRMEFDHMLKRQTGGAGLFARVLGYIEPYETGNLSNLSEIFVNKIVGGVIPQNLIVACERGYRDVLTKGVLINAPIVGIRVVLLDGVTHEVDSNEYAFRNAMISAMVDAIKRAEPVILEPHMKVTVTIPHESFRDLISSLGKRRGTILTSQNRQDNLEVLAHVPLSDMFGFTSLLRSISQGKGEFTMEYLRHEQVLPQTQIQLMQERVAEIENKKKSKK